MTRGYNAAFITTSWKDLESQDLPNVFVRRDRVTMVHVIETGGNWSAVRPSFFNQKCFSKLYPWVNTHDVNHIRTCGIGEISWTHPQQKFKWEYWPQLIYKHSPDLSVNVQTRFSTQWKNVFPKNAGISNENIFFQRLLWKQLPRTGWMCSDVCSIMPDWINWSDKFSLCSVYFQQIFFISIVTFLFRRFSLLSVLKVHNKL